MHWIGLAFALCVNSGIGRRVKLLDDRLQDAQKEPTSQKQSGASDAVNRLALFALSYAPGVFAHAHPRSDRIARSSVLGRAQAIPGRKFYALPRARPGARLRRPLSMTTSIDKTAQSVDNASQVVVNKADAYDFSQSNGSFVSTKVPAKDLSADNSVASSDGTRQPKDKKRRSLTSILMGVVRRMRRMRPAEAPRSAVGLDGGDVWDGMIKNRHEIIELAHEALSTSAIQPIIPQYYPSRQWLWAQWSGTIVRRTLPREVFLNCLVALAASSLIHFSGAEFAAKMEGVFSGVARAWTLSATMASFMLSFFLSQSYTLWRTAYSITRKIQGRLNDIGLLCSQFASRNSTTGRYTEEADELLSTIARYIRLFHILFYASVTSKYASLRLPKGLKTLKEQNAMTAEECELLIQSSMGHNAVIGWLAGLIDQGVADGRLSCGAARSSGSSPIAVQMQLARSIVELRGTYASLKDQLSARMPLAYVQLVQILTDFLMFFTPFALVHSVGPFGCVMGTAVVTLFHSSIVTLAKLFLDPLNNEVEKRGGDPGIGGIRVATLLQETNIGSERWRKSVVEVPEAVFKKTKADMTGYEERIAAVLAGSPASDSEKDNAMGDAAAAVAAFDGGTGASFDISDSL